MNIVEQSQKSQPGAKVGPLIVTPYYIQSVEGCLTDKIGRGGLSPAEFDGWLARVWPAIESLRQDYKRGLSAILTIPQERDDMVAAEAAFNILNDGARTVVFFGTGGSSLGGQTFAQYAGWNIPGDALHGQDDRPRTRFYDNLDPRTLIEHGREKIR